MAAGISAYLANKLLDHATGRAAFTMPAGVYAKSTRTTPAPTAPATRRQTTRIATTFAAAAAGAIAMNNTPEFTQNATETIRYVTFWDHATAGNFLWSAQATVEKGGANGDIIRIATNSLTLGPLAS